MKPSMNKFRNAIIAAIILLNVTSVTTSYGAATTKAAFDFNFIGNNESFPVFQLKMENAEDEEYEIVIRDVKHETLHQETLKGKSLSRKYRLDVEPADLGNIRFVLTNKRTNETNVYQVVNNSYVVDNVSVTRM
jgi:hypothetical protein